ncbi:MAG: lytic transglycosylase domain-containing protein [FCB group bacterium]|jgi:hypothetical protein|nr:lytic transglycosylase domain-containing protein [FCB group bacterium]
MATVGTRSRVVRLAAAIFLLLAPMAFSEEPLATTKPPTLKSKAGAINPQTRKSIDAELKRQKRARAQRFEESGVRIFEDKSGVPMITNRLAKYRAKPSFKEVHLDFEKIVVDPTYKRLKESDTYNAGSIEDLVDRHSKRWNVDKNLIFAIIKAESNFRQDAVSSAGACGLMQLMPGTAGEMGVTDVFDPAENIAGGTQYIAKLLALFDDNHELALAGYNAGPQTVINCGHKVPNIKETRNYVKRVQEYWQAFAGHRELPTYVKAKNPRKIVTPKADPDLKLKTIYYLSGLTQPVEKVIDQHADYYYVEFKGRMWSVPKRLVKEIV